MPVRKSPPKFGVGVDVRVKRGVVDPDFEDVPIGGWAGRITEMQYLNPPLYLIRWDQHTLNNIHPIYRNRCERDGFDIEEMWLAENDLEPGTGDPVPIEQPTKIVTSPLNMDDQDDRIRSVFNLTSDDLLPESDEESLRAYYKFLAANLAFPFEAKYSYEPRPLESKTCAITVLGLLDPEEFPGDDHGLFCQARRDGEVIELPLTEVEVAKGNPNARLIDDYTVWFVNW
jgi:hypothetical protein